MRLSKSRGFTKKERVKQKKEIQNLFKTGKRMSVRGAKLFFLPSDLAFNRVAFALPRGYGTAIQRNFAKRISREVYRNLKGELARSYDLLFLFYPGNDTISIRENQIRLLCKKAGLLC